MFDVFDVFDVICMFEVVLFCGVFTKLALSDAPEAICSLRKNKGSEKYSKYVD